MSRVSSNMRGFAKRLIVSDGSAKTSLEPAPPAGFPVIDALRPQLAMLMGKDGVRALLARAFALATTEVAWLETVCVGADGNLQGLEAAHAGLSPDEALEGRVVVVAQLLALLVAFIGPILTSRLVGGIWPRIPFEDRDFAMEHENEATD